LAIFRHLAAVLALFVAPAALAQDKPVFVELVYEVDIAPLEGAVLPTLRGDEAPLGYAVADFPQGRVVYPATGAGGPAPQDGAPLIGFRLRNGLLSHDGSVPDAKRLLAPPPGAFAEPIAPEDGVAPPIPYSLILRDDTSVEIASNGARVALAPGQFTAVATAERTLDRPALIAAIRAAADPGSEPSDAAIQREADLLLLGEERVTIHARLSAANFGHVTVSATDLSAAWAEASRLAREGPYPAAVEALDAVLAALPGLEEARRLRARSQALADAGLAAMRATGRLQFTDGPPGDDVRALWQALHPGYARFEPLGAPDAVQAVPAAIADGAFSAVVPAGRWRVVVDVPGYEVAEVTVTADQEITFDVPLRRAP